jgi:hypothetical protein
MLATIGFFTRWTSMAISEEAEAVPPGESMRRMIARTLASFSACFSSEMTRSGVTPAPPVSPLPATPAIVPSR